MSDRNNLHSWHHYIYMQIDGLEKTWVVDVQCRKAKGQSEYTEYFQ